MTDHSFAECAWTVNELLETQVSLRRLALLIAKDAAPEVIFGAVTKEVLRRFGDGTARLVRYEKDGTATLVANEGTIGPHVQVGHRWKNYPENGLTEQVWRTGQSAHVDDYRLLPGGEPYAREGLRCAVGMPIHVHGRLWGMVAVGSGGGPLPADAEHRMIDFTNLIATAVATAQSRAELEASRARIVAAADEARWRIRRDIHDGAQQHLVALVLRLRQIAVKPGNDKALNSELLHLADVAANVVKELRDLAHGIHPVALTHGGLGPALRALARRTALPVDVRVDFDRRLPEAIEVNAYYVISEAITNATKHARASSIDVQVQLRSNRLHIHVTDNGIGGADPTLGSGLTGLRDRIEALSGTFGISSRANAGTTVWCDLPAMADTNGQEA